MTGRDENGYIPLDAPGVAQPRSSRRRTLSAGAVSPSIREVARAAGVSVATVSRVVNAKGAVRDATRRAVRETIARLHYVPHSAARSLSSRRTLNVGVLLPDVHGEFFSELVRGIDLAARAAGYHLLVSSSHADLAETAAVLHALHGRIDGLILLTAGIDGGWLPRHLPRRIPAVLLNPAAPSRSHDSIRVDNRRGAQMATEHLLDLGHRRIAFVGGPADNEDAAERRRAYRAALAARGVDAASVPELPGDFGQASGYQAGLAIARLVPRPTAVFAANDAMAIGCLAALHERGVAVPAEVSLVGFDDIPVARYLAPPLTTVGVAIADFGGRSMRRLLAVLAAGRPLPRVDEVLTPILAIRASTAAVAASSFPSRPTRRRSER